MADAAPMVEIVRGEMIESLHRGHWVISRPSGEIVEAWGDPRKVIYPRSSVKILQALPLLESGAGTGLSREELALACASHEGEAEQVERIVSWLERLGIDEHALLCGSQASRDRSLRHAMIREGRDPGPAFNICSGKHAGFLTVAQHLKAGPDYVDPGHPVQRAVRAAIEEVCCEESRGVGIDGCSAPTFSMSIAGLARGMARIAAAGRGADARDRAAAELRDSMIAHPEMVAGRGRACTKLMRAARGRAAIKTGAEGVFVAMLPEHELGIVLKIEDGATRAAEVAIAALLVRLGVLEAGDPEVSHFLSRPICSRVGQIVGMERPVLGLA